jgi:transposase
LLAPLALPPAARERIEVCLRMIEAGQVPQRPLAARLRSISRRQAGCRALRELFGIGPITAPTNLAELGDVTRLRRSRQAVRCSGLDVGVSRSDRRSRLGKLSKQGSPQLRWALYEAAQSATHKRSPDHADYLRLRERGLLHTRASLTIARKLARRSYHILGELGEGRSSRPELEPGPCPILRSMPTHRRWTTFRLAPLLLVTPARGRWPSID